MAEIRLHLNETDGTTLRPGPEQSSLRPAQHFHTLDVEKTWECRA
jgi:hypothetical protein